MRSSPAVSIALLAKLSLIHQGASLGPTPQDDLWLEAPQLHLHNKTVHASTASPGRPSFTIGFLHEISTMPFQELPIRAAVQIAIDQINADPHLLPYVTLVLKEADTEGQEREAEIGTLEFTKEPSLVALVGPSRSNAAIAAQCIAQIFLIPHISGSATLSSLSDKNYYPTFLRTNGGGYTQLLAQLINEMGWQKTVTLTHTARFFMLETIEFEKTLSKSNLTVAHQFNFNDENALTTLKKIRLGKERVIVLFADKGSAIMLMKHARTLGMVDAGWQWIGNHKWIGDDSQTDPRLQVGILGLVPRPVTNQGLITAWAKANQTVGRNITIFQPYGGYTGTAADITWETEATYDAVWVIATALDSLTRTHHTSVDKEELLQAMMDVKLVDSEGHTYLEMDRNTRSRAAEYAVINGGADGTLQEVGYFDVHGTLKWVTPITFGGGTQTHPLDTSGCEPNQRVVHSTCKNCPPGYCSQGSRAKVCIVCNEIKDAYPESFMTVIKATTCTSLLLAVLAGMCIVRYRDDALMIHSMPSQLGLAILGCIIMLVYPIGLTFPPTKRICMARVWTRFLGISIVLGVMLVKVWHRSGQPQSVLPKPVTTERRAGLDCAMLVVSMGALLLSWSLLSAPDVVTMAYRLNGTVISYQECYEDRGWHWALTGLVLALWLVCAAQATRTRTDPREHHESHYILVASGMNAMVCFALMGLHFFFQNSSDNASKAYANLAEGVQYIAMALISLLLITVPKLVGVGRKRMEAHKTTLAAGSSSGDGVDTWDELGLAEGLTAAEENIYLQSVVACTRATLVGLGNRHLGSAALPRTSRLASMADWLPPRPPQTMAWLGTHPASKCH